MRISDWSSDVCSSDLLARRLFPSVGALRNTLAEKAEAYSDVVKTGRTHLQDATPITLGQEIGAWVAQIDFALDAVQSALPGVYDLAIGGTAVGTGLNAHLRFGEVAARHIRSEERRVGKVCQTV